MAHYYPGVPVSEIDEPQLSGYLQNIARIEQGRCAALASILSRLLKR